MKKLLKKQETANNAFVKYPHKSDNQIAKITGISQPMISKYRKSYSLQVDSEFIAITAGKFIQEFGHAADHWKLLIDEIEVLKNGDVDPIDKLSLIKEQASLRERILFLASQGEVREVIKIMRSGKLPQLPVIQ